MDDEEVAKRLLQAAKVGADGTLAMYERGNQYRELYENAVGLFQQYLDNVQLLLDKIAEIPSKEPARFEECLDAGKQLMKLGNDLVKTCREGIDDLNNGYQKLEEQIPKLRRTAGAEAS
jgi:hypothetical protein